MSETLTADVLGRYKNRVFVETGTYKGGGIQLALDLGFEDIRSVEFLRERFNEVSQRFAGDARVKLFCGNSGELMKEVIADISEAMTFWLDGHSYDYAPVMEELAAIAQHPIKTHTILIDDRHHWHYWRLNEQKIKAFLLGLNPSYQFRYEANWVGPEDILVAFPS